MRAASPRARAFLIVLLLLGLGLRLQEVTPLLSHLGERDNPGPELRDFRDALYEPGHDLREGHNPYDPGPYTDRHPGHQELDLYGPQVFLLAVPFSMLPVAAAQVLWLVALALATLLLAWSCWALIGRPPDAWVVAGTCGALLATNAMSQVVLTGNIALLCAATGLAAVHLSRRRPLAAGALLAVALIKPQLGVPFALVLGVCLGRWRAVAAGAGIAAALAIVPTIVVVAAAGGVNEFAESVGRNLDLSTELAGDIAGRADLLRVDLWGAIGKLADVNPTTVTQLATLACFIGLAAVVIRRRALHRSAVLAAPAVGLVAAAVVAGMPHYPYDLTLLTALVVGALWGAWGTRHQPLLAWGLALLGAAALFHLGFADDMLSRAGLGRDLRYSIDAILVALAYAVALAATARLARAAPRGHRG